VATVPLGALAPFTPNEDRTVKDKIILFYVYEDGNDAPWLIRNPPENLNAILDEWKSLGEDAKPDDWDEDDLSQWLKARGVDIFAADGELFL
jgi:hypothetical protein